MTALSNRHDFTLVFDVTNGNPNGDPDAGNLPRLDPETGKGLVSDVCLKRKIRNYVELARGGRDGFHIYIEERAILNEKHRQAYKVFRPDGAKLDTAKELNPTNDEEAWKRRDFMCRNFFDIRSFGAVMSTGINRGQVKGPVQMTFATSVEPVMPLEMSITRMAATNEVEKNNGPKATTAMGERKTAPWAASTSSPMASMPRIVSSRRNSPSGRGFPRPISTYCGRRC